MIDLSDSVCIGTITKTHGIKGYVILRLDNTSSDDILKMESVFIEIDGLPVPFFIKDYEEKASDTLFLSLENIDSEESARELTGCKLYVSKINIRAKKEDNFIQNLTQLLGYTVIDKKLGELGKLEDIMDIDMNPLFKIVNQKQEILLPVQTEYISHIDKENNIIHVITPEGLISLF